MIAKIVRDRDQRPSATSSRKANRIVDLPLADGSYACRPSNSADILVVDDKPVIVQQIQEGLRHTPWKIHSATSQAEALEFCTKTVPDLILASLALPEDGAFSLFRLVRANNKTKYTPVFALVVKTDILTSSSSSSRLSRYRHQAAWT